MIFFLISLVACQVTETYTDKDVTVTIILSNTQTSQLNQMQINIAFAKAPTTTQNTIYIPIIPFILTANSLVITSPQVPYTMTNPIALQPYKAFPQNLQIQILYMMNPSVQTTLSVSLRFNSFSFANKIATKTFTISPPSYQCTITASAPTYDLSSLTFVTNQQTSIQYDVNITVTQQDTPMTLSSQSCYINDINIPSYCEQIDQYSIKLYSTQQTQNFTINGIYNPPSMNKYSYQVTYSQNQQNVSTTTCTLNLQKLSQQQLIIQSTSYVIGQSSQLWLGILNSQYILANSDVQLTFSIPTQISSCANGTMTAVSSTVYNIINFNAAQQDFALIQCATINPSIIGVNTIQAVVSNQGFGSFQAQATYTLIQAPYKNFQVQRVNTTVSSQTTLTITIQFAVLQTGNVLIQFPSELALPNDTQAFQNGVFVKSYQMTNLATICASSVFYSRATDVSNNQMEYLSQQIQLIQTPSQLRFSMSQLQSTNTVTQVTFDLPINSLLTLQFDSSFAYRSLSCSGCSQYNQIQNNISIQSSTQNQYTIANLLSPRSTRQFAIDLKSYQGQCQIGYGQLTSQVISPQNMIVVLQLSSQFKNASNVNWKILTSVTVDILPTDHISFDFGQYSPSMSNCLYNGFYMDCQNLSNRYIQAFTSIEIVIVNVTNPMSALTMNMKVYDQYGGQIAVGQTIYNSWVTLWQNNVTTVNQTYCPQNCSTCNNTQCTGCNNGYYLYYSTCVIECPSTYYNSIYGCQKCQDSQCSICSSLACLTCMIGYEVVNGRCQEIIWPKVNSTEQALPYQDTGYIVIYDFPGILLVFMGILTYTLLKKTLNRKRLSLTIIYSQLSLLEHAQAIVLLAIFATDDAVNILFLCIALLMAHFTLQITTSLKLNAYLLVDPNYTLHELSAKTVHYLSLGYCYIYQLMRTCGLPELKPWALFDQIIPIITTSMKSSVLYSVYQINIIIAAILQTKRIHTTFFEILFINVISITLNIYHQFKFKSNFDKLI